MPKRVDRQERRRQLSDALTRLAAARGLDGISLRHVAAEAGVSTGMVQHYFRSKDELMAFALETVHDTVRARLAARGPERSASPRATVRALLVELLPLDEERSREAHVAMAFLAYSAARPSLAEALYADDDLMRDFMADRIREAGEPGRTPPGQEPARAATALLALTEGLGTTMLLRPEARDDLLATFDSHLDLVFGPEPAHDSTSANGPDAAETR